MITTVMVEREIDFGFVCVRFPIRGDADIAYDFPLRRGDIWSACIDIDEGLILQWPDGISGWPDGISGEFSINVSDQGTYTLFNRVLQPVASIDKGHVPNALIPGEYGCHIELKINEFGVITNWPKDPDVSDFFPDMED